MDVITPQNLQEALEELAKDPCAGVLAGGTDLLVKWKSNTINPPRVFTILGLQELNFIREEEGRLCIGPLVTHQDLAESAVVQRHAPLLAKACAQVGSLQIRNRGTIGGNLVTASPAGDTIPALVVLNASVVLQSAQGERQVPLREFITGPGKTVLQPGELLTAVSFPCMEATEVGFYRKLGQRQAMAISIVNLALKATLENAVIKDISIACGSVGPTVVELKRTANRLKGHSLDTSELRNIVVNAGDETNPISDIRASEEYRRQMVGELLYEGLQSLRRQSAG
ncbi:FAD binding domain-containing protein [Desulforamulus aeronauticus]|uniref:Xanthine dehydrogenase FAD-binding subunit n=1 Tax=Desulforamulus aeronauticus DSM 10349 TaxID=1121421 RepID=A0A1M6UH05_9FIRM|nr:xanthine dehydrogenase family protein subunit M [Desulforamulus aeronauticus]SHK68512.1 xanthine dehydrogenase FAD-binding subunit [Desulforamulus aeronauticus DSM 10349]